MSCGAGCRRGSDPKLLWLWRRPAAAAPIRHLTWELPYATGADLKREKKKKKNPIVAGITLEVGGSILSPGTVG